MRPTRAYDLAVRRSRTGLGLFAGGPIPAGVRVIEYIGEALDETEWASVNSRYLFAVSARRTIDGSSRANVARYINHSCAANCEPEVRRGRVFIVSKRAIEPGEELTYDYGLEYFTEFIAPRGCRCAACEPHGG